MKKWISALCTLTALLATGCSTPPAGKATAPAKITIPEQKLLTLRMKGPFEKMNKAFGQVYAAMGKLSLAPAGTSFAIYFNDPAKVKPADYDWEVCVPVNKKAKPETPVAFRVQKKNRSGLSGVHGSLRHKSPHSLLQQTDGIRQQTERLQIQRSPQRGISGDQRFSRREEKCDTDLFPDCEEITGNTTGGGDRPLKHIHLESRLRTD